MSALSESAIAQQHPSLYASLNPLLRTSPGNLEAYLSTVSCRVAIPKTQTMAHCHFICLDGNKRPRVRDFARFLATTRITDFAIPRAQIKRALNESVRLGSSSPIDRLNAEARKLFTRLPKSGEGGEVILSLLAETLLQLPQLFTKMVLKTNTEMHVHGSDGIHVGVNKATGHLALYWGESKLYQDASAAIRDCLASLAPFLKDPGGSDAASACDLRLMRDGIALDDPVLEDALKHYLDPDDPLFNQLTFCGLCLVGFDSDSYPTSPNSKEAQQVKEAIEKSFESNKKQILKRINEEQIESFTIEVFCFPFPSVDEFRQAFRAELGLSSEQD